MKADAINMKQKSGMVKIWSLFTGFLVLFVLNLFANTGDNPTANIWLVLAVCVTILSVVMLIKNKLPEKKQILISLLFGLSLFAAYTITFKTIGFSSVQVPVVTIVCALASFSVFNTYRDKAIKLLKSGSLKSVCLSISIGAAVGIIWGIANLFLGGNPGDIKITPAAFLMALSPGIYEEIAFRGLLFAVCLYFFKGSLDTKSKQFTCWFMMIIPHVMIHTPGIFITNGVINGIVSIIMLTVLFGLPFAFLQRKRDLTSAMIAHGVLVAIRFCVYGINV
jgi:hypothetical protein